jgi:DNA (cytosine-5)-methyltransferase 1
MTVAVNRNISAVDLFCGVGGLTRGLEDAGIDVRLGVDLDPACQFAYEKNNRAEFKEADVSTLEAASLRKVFSGGGFTLLAGCAPCQPFSTYARSSKGMERKSRRAGKTDDWVLVRRFGELVAELQPDLVTMENVPPLADQPVFADFLYSLSGYSVDYAVVDSRTIGLPQSRQRLVLVASKLGPIQLAIAELEEATVRQTIGGLPALRAGERDADDPLHVASKLSPKNLARIKASCPGGTWRDWPEELRAQCHRRPTGATYPSVYGRMEWDKPSPTITTQCFGYGNGRFGHPEQNRAISLREAAMLQGFPRSYAFLPDGQRANFAALGKLIGNAVPVPLGTYIGRTLLEHVRAARVPSAHERRSGIPGGPSASSRPL